MGGMGGMGDMAGLGGLGGMGGMGGLGGMGGMGGMGMGPYGNQDPNSMGPPASPPGFWVSFLRVVRYFLPHMPPIVTQNCYIDLVHVKVW